MTPKKFIIYTLKGSEILSRGQKVEKTLVDPFDRKEKSAHLMEYHIDLSNDFEKMLLIKNEENPEQDDTALYYQIRKELGFSNASCLTDKILIVDFENLFMNIKEDVYFDYNRIKKERDLEATDLADTFSYEQIQNNPDISQYINNTLSPYDKKMSDTIDKREHNIFFTKAPLIKSEAIRQLFKTGMKVKFTKDGEERTFVPFDKSQSMARHSKITFIDISLQTDVNRRLLLGLDKIGPFASSKFYAYKGLYLSSGQRITNNDLILNEETVIVLPNGPEFTDEEIEYITNKTDSTEISIDRQKGLTIDTMFDGEGIISTDYADLLNKSLDNHNRKATSFQIRMPFIKGMVHTVDMESFLNDFCGEDTQKIMITDCFGIKRNLRKAKIIITQSMYKAYVKGGTDWFCYDANYLYSLSIDNSDPMKNYFNAFHKYCHALYISGTNLPYKNRDLTALNYQFLNTLKLTEDELKTLVDNHMYYVEHPIEYLRRNAAIISSDESDSENDIESDTDTVNIQEDIEITSEDSIGNDEDSSPDDKGENADESSDDTTDTPFPKAASLSAPNWQLALFENTEFSENPYIKSRLNAIRDSLKKNIAFGRLLVDGEVRYLSRDLLYFLKYILDCIENKQNNELKEMLSNEVNRLADKFYMPSPNIAITSEYHYPIFRSPHLSRNEQCAIKAFIPDEKESLRHKYLGHLEGVLMVAYNSFVPDALGGADFDGDIVKIFHSDILRDAVLRGAYSMEYKYNVDEKYRRTLPIIKISAFKSDASDYYRVDSDIEELTNSDVNYDVIFHTFSNKVGTISNLAIKLGKKHYALENQVNDKGNGNEKQIENTSVYLCEKCTILTGLEIDACKTGRHPELTSTLAEAKDISRPYITDFLKTIKKLRFISGNNFTKLPDEKYEYINYKNETCQVSKSPYDILELLSFYFMEKVVGGKKPKAEKAVSSTEEEHSTKVPATSYLFKFEEDNDKTEENNNKTKELIKKLRNLIKAYKYATRMVTEYNKQYYPDNSSKWRRYIFFIWSNQDGNSPESSIEYGRIYRKILMYIGDALVKKLSVDTDTNYTDILNNFVDSEWPYLCSEEEKKDFLSDFCNIAVEELDEDVTERLCNFSCRGYNLLYMFIREANHRVKFADFKTVAQKQIDTGDFLFDDKNVLKNEDIRNYLVEALGNTKESFSYTKSYFFNLFKRKIDETFTDKEELFKLLYKVSGRSSDATLNSFFWDYYSADDIKERIYSDKESGKNA